MMDTKDIATGKASTKGVNVEDLKLAASKMKGMQRRTFQAEMVLKYCAGSARLGESVFGWSRHTISIGLAETRTGLECFGLQSLFGGRKSWEESHPDAAQALLALAQSHSQQDPSFRTTLSYTRLTAKEALKQLSGQGFAPEVLPAPSTMADILNRNGYRLRAVVKAKPQKKFQKLMPSSPMCGTRMARGAKRALSND